LSLERALKAQGDSWGKAILFL